MLNVEMLSTGDEVLHGQIIDTNAAWLADFFFNQGLPLTRRNTVGDDLDALVAILRERSEQADVLIVNGARPNQRRPERAGRRHCERRRAYFASGVAGNHDPLFCRARQADGGKQP